MPSPRPLSPRFWIAGRAQRLVDDGMDAKAARQQARAEWEALTLAMRALYRTPPPLRPCFEVMSDRAGAN